MLELHDERGRTGTGFFSNLFHPLPDRAELLARLRRGGLSRPAGAAARGPRTPDRPPAAAATPARCSHGFGEAIDQALWDLAAQQAGLPLWRYLGGTSPRVRAYASGLDFHLSDEDFARFFAAARAQGFAAFKIKVGHPELAPRPPPPRVAR